jgi:GTPase SAR1 family protein
VLVSFGATWDIKCGELVSSGNALDEALALHICMLLWSQELADGFPITKIPLEVIKRGADSTQTYIDDVKTSTTSLLRRKICLVGSSCAGKTSLVKSIISEEPQLEHVDDRTIGIDHFPLRFSEPNIVSDGKRKIHEVTFWDFAGQDAYQVAHSLFFSPRTLYLVCVDLQAFAIAYMQAVIFADEETQEINLLDEFIEDSVMRWVRMIVTRQPDAEFVFIMTKEDTLEDNNVTEQLLKDSLMTKLRRVEATVKLMRDQLEKDEHFADDGLMFRSQLPVSVDAPEPTVVCASCTSPDSVKAIRRRIQELIIQSKRSFEMPDSYTKALEAIVGIRVAAQANNMTTRIHRVFAPVESLPAALNIEPKLCHTILQTLHDLGDVLWYGNLGIELFENIVILEPLLLIDFIRHVITHKHTGVTMSHADLTSKRFWMGLSSQEQMEAMKQVLYKFRLVYPDDEERVMRWDSDLIVPAFWQTKTPASWKFLGDILRINKSRSHEAEAVRIDCRERVSVYRV